MKRYGIFFSILAIPLLLHGAVRAVTIQDAVYTTKNAGKVVFNHGSHLRQNGLANNCRACHDAIFNLKKKKHYSMADMNKGLSCGTCHDGKRAFSADQCVRCHQTKEKTYAVKATGQTRFSHKQHLATFPDCSGCHPAIFAAGKNKRFSMADMEKGQSCGACHNSKEAFSVKECSKCHPTREITFIEKDTGNVNFSHTNHTSLYTCGECHVKVFSTVRSKSRVSMKEMEKGKSCGFCHDGKSAFGVAADKDCDKCHKM